ncbi:MAG: lysine--tRNA ligase [Patescibacteria group bacterium]
MASIEELKQARIAKIEKLKKAGMDPYPATILRDYSISEVKTSFADLASKSETNPISIAGRVMIVRGQGAILFIVLQDGKDRLQAVLKKDVLSADSFSLFVDTVDNGDFISVTGSLFVTDRGEQSILIKDWKMGAKALLPLPDKWGGLQDVEERFRKRYLDFITTPELQDIFIKKARFWEVTREFMNSHGFLEVETPTLEVTTGGAEARPFETHHNDFDIDVYLRISVGELWQKRLMAAGFPKTFEIGRVYRNEGSSPEHLQEFTNMEFYGAYISLSEGKKLVRDMFISIAEKVFGTTQFNTRGYSFDLSEEWQEIDYVDEIKKTTGIDIFENSEEDMMNKLHELGVTYEGKNKERLTDSLWKFCRKKIAGPTFLINHPKLVAPLSKTHPLDSRKTDMFQVLIAGSELGRGHAELNDPIDQKERFEMQQKLIEKGDDEAMMADMEYVEMMEHGMPPTFGFGFGERLFAFMVDKPIRETQLFPLMKPKDEK